MNALLLYPQFPDTFWSFKHALRFIRKRRLRRHWALSPWQRCFRHMGGNGWWT